MRKLVLAFLTSIALTAVAQAAETKLTWYGHAAFEVVTPKGKVLLIDPWLSNPMNPAAQGGKDPTANLGKVDYILVTHGHFDHVGDSVKIAKKTGARLVTNFELGQNMARLLGYPEKQMGFDTLFNIGGEIPIADGEVTVTMTPAIHSSGLDDPKGKKPIAYGGNPGGFVLRIKDGPTIYDTGDTAYFSDMSAIGSQYAPDVALINIGGHFGMEPYMAAKAAEAVKAKWSIPMHYKTFPVLTQSAADFSKALESRHLGFKEMKPGETLIFRGQTLKK